MYTNKANTCKWDLQCNTLVYVNVLLLSGNVHFAQVIEHSSIM